MTPLAKIKIKSNPMKRTISLAGAIGLTTLILALLSITSPAAWSDSGKRPSLRENDKKDVSIKENDKSKLDRKNSENAVIESSDRGGNAVKKKAMKKAGAAAAVGIAGKKVSSEIRK